MVTMARKLMTPLIAVVPWLVECAVTHPALVYTDDVCEVLLVGLDDVLPFASVILVVFEPVGRILVLVVLVFIIFDV